MNSTHLRNSISPVQVLLEHTSQERPIVFHKNTSTTGSHNRINRLRQRIQFEVPKKLEALVKQMNEKLGLRKSLDLSLVDRRH